MYEYFVAYRWYGNWKGSKEGYGNMNIPLEERISKTDDIDNLRKKIREEYPEFDTIIIMFYQEFKV